MGMIIGRSLAPLNSLRTMQGVRRRDDTSREKVQNVRGDSSADGSGVLVTNLHVIQGGTEVTVTLANGDIYDDVAVVDVDERRDLVLLKIKAFGLVPASFGDSDAMQVGESVVLVGSPEGLDFTVSEGVISALRDSGSGYQLFQTSAPA